MLINERSRNRKVRPPANCVVELKRINDRIEVVSKQIAIHQAELKYLKTYLSKLTAQSVGK